MTYWFLLVALYVVMYFFNGGVTASPATKNIVNVVGIIATIVLAIFATKLI